MYVEIQTCDYKVERIVPLIITINASCHSTMPQNCQPLTLSLPTKKKSKVCQPQATSALSHCALCAQMPRNEFL